MVAAPDAVLVDSSTQAIEDVVDSLVRRVEAVRGTGAL
jgi:cytidylate kinase